MSMGLREQPATQRTWNGGIPARRALIRWGMRLLRREWRQQLLILALITVAVAATVLFNAPGVSPSDIGPTVATPQTVAAKDLVNPETISIAAAVLGMLLIAMVGAGGFTVLAQRRLRSIGMLAAQGARQSNIRLVVRANGVATGAVGAVAGFVLGLAGSGVGTNSTGNSSAQLLEVVLGFIPLVAAVVLVSIPACSIPSTVR